MDADLQDEPEVLLEMYRVLRTERLDVVYAVRARPSRGKSKTIFLLSFLPAFRIFS